MDLTHWYCWVTIAGAVIGLLSAVQQLLLHGLRPLVRAVCVTFLVGLGLALAYPHMPVRTIGSGPSIPMAVNAAPVQPAPVQPELVERFPPSPPSARSAAAPVDPTSAESTLAESTLAEPTLPGPTTVPSASKPAELVPVEPAPISRAPVNPGVTPTERARTVNVKPALPALLPGQQKLFSPSEVGYCPACLSAYSSKGPTVGVKCPHCAEKVDLVSLPDYMVHRCSKCGKLCRTTHFPPAIGPYFFRYHCPFCKEYRWFLK